MDLDAYVGAHHLAWRRLEDLSQRRPASGEEADELVDLYQEVATHLSVIRSSAPDAATVSYLSGLLARARIRSVGTRSTFSKRSISGTALTTDTSRPGALTEVCTSFGSMKLRPNGS